MVVGLGKPAAADARMLEDLGGTLVAHLNGVGETAATFAIETSDAAEFARGAVAAHLALGAALRAYRFDKYRTTEKPERKPTLSMLTVAGLDARRRLELAHKDFAATAEAVAFARDLVSEPANVIYPETLPTCGRPFPVWSSR